MYTHKMHLSILYVPYAPRCPLSLAAILPGALKRSHTLQNNYLLASQASKTHHRHLSPLTFSSEARPMHRKSSRYICRAQVHSFQAHTSAIRMKPFVFFPPTTPVTGQTPRFKQLTKAAVEQKPPPLWNLGQAEII